VSRETRERRLKAEENWPDLRRFLESYLHEDWDRSDASPEAAIDRAIDDHPLEIRQTIVRQWWDWNNVESSQYDPRPAINDGLGVHIHFESPEAGRHFMNMVYDKLIVSIRKVVEHWKP
jgi:hypothetical protein